MKAEEVHRMSLDEMLEEEERLRRQLFDLRCQAVTEKLENPRQLRAIRKDIARILTVKRAREIEATKQD